MNFGEVILTLAAAAEMPAYAGWLLPVLVVGILVQFLWSSIVTFTVYQMTKNDRNTAGLEKRLHDANVKLIDERFRSVSHEIRNEVTSFVATLHEMKERLKDGDSDINALSDRDQKLELKLSGCIETLKDYIRDNCASKEDVRDHEQHVRQQFARVGDKVESLGKEVAVLASKIEERA